jgi:uncharacterized membrane protein
MNETETTSWRQVTAMVFLWLAAGLALFLALQSVGSLPLPGCGEKASCHQVLESRFSYLLGMPMAWLGFGTYCLLILTSGAWVRREATLAATLGSLLAGVATGAALWFIGVQAVVLKQWCPWCLTTHVSVLTAVVLLQRERRLTSATPAAPNRPDATSHGWMLGGLLASAALLALSGWHGKAPVASAVVVSQPVSPATGTLNANAGPEVWHLALGDHPLSLDLTSLPLMGPPTAERTAVLLSDYTCDHCRHYHETLESLLGGLQPPVRLILLPASRDEEGKAVQRCLLSLYQTDRDAWKTLHGRLIRGDIPPVPGLVAEAARKLVGAEAWSAAVRSHQDKVDAGLAAAHKVQLHNRAAYPDASVLPQLMAGSAVLMGAESDRQVIVRFLTENTSPMALAAPSKPAGISGLTLQNDNVDLGKVPAGSAVRVVLKVMNRSLEPLNLGRAEMDMGLLIVTQPGSAVGGGSLLECVLDCQVPTTAGPFVREITFHTAEGQPLTARIRGLSVPGDASLASAAPARQP